MGPIDQAVEMLNNPWDHEDTLRHHLPDRKETKFDFSVRLMNAEDPQWRIYARKEELEFSEDVVLYVKWDDSGPLTARDIVNTVIQMHGLDNFYAAGSAYNRSPHVERDKLFRVQDPDVVYLKVAPSSRDPIEYQCSDCGKYQRDGPSELSLSIDVSDL